MPLFPADSPPDGKKLHPDLLLGPVLRRVEGTRATVWVETAHPATVEVSAGPGHGTARTFSAYGHHYAIVVVDGLPPGASTPYQVSLDGQVVWPTPDDDFPPCAIRTRADGDPVRLVFGSCREATPYTHPRFLPDALDAYAVRLATNPDPAAWPDSLVLLGDQVYADMTSPTVKRWLKRRRRRRHRRAPQTQVVDFHEYTKLYLESWTDREIRWLLSTVPSVMIFDDHEIIDDWNTSAAWRDRMQAQPWWPRRISAGLASYWVYQHLGNLAPDALAADPVYAQVTAAGDATGVLEKFGLRADEEREEYRWSYALDIGRTRIAVLDNRCGRQLEPGRRAMLPDTEWAWFVEQTRGDYDHLVIGSSLPWLMPHALHHIEAANERLCESDLRPVAALAETVRQAWDLEHWAAFGRSFDAMGALLTQIGTADTAGAGPDGPHPPATISVLSGDVHHSYAARVELGPTVDSAVFQLVCSPVHNQVPPALRPAFALAWGRGSARFTRALARAVGQPRPSVSWRKIAGPYFGNAIASLVHAGRSAELTVEGTPKGGGLRRVAAATLAGND